MANEPTKRYYIDDDLVKKYIFLLLTDLLRMN